MGERITTSERAEGCVTQSFFGGVSIVEPRVKYVKGWLTGGTDPEDGSVECGAGTEYPMMVSLDEMCEIFYRVRDGWFTAGAINSNTQVEDKIPIAGQPNANLAFISTSPDYEYQRGYHWFDATQQLYHGTIYDYNGSSVQDAESELAMFNRPYTFSSLNHYLYSGSDAVTPVYGFDTDSGTIAELNIESPTEVAYIGDSPYDAGATLYARFQMVVSADYAGSRFLDTYKDFFADPVLAPVDLTIELSNSTLSIPLYRESEETLSYDEDFVFTVKKWWEYADNAGLPAWDSTTGLPINGGPVG